ncbi:glutamine amidotransferase-related protein [Methanoculleus sp.]|uniref:glutamine amidotransferase-related protein n=1 Tax=Methanoculleus sp. TaxID=90427 RepID=UPI002FCC4B26
MILVLDLCYRDGSLSRDEFVAPVNRLLHDAGVPSTVRHYTAVGAPELEAAEAVVICGTALKDTGFAGHPGRFSWLSSFERPVLGISSGMRVLAAAFGGGTEPCCQIGMIDVRVLAGDPLFAGKETFTAYELHEYAICVPDRFIPLAASDRCVQAIRHRSLPLYGLLFHPEVRNEWVIERFLALVEDAR